METRENMLKNTDKTPKKMDKVEMYLVNEHEPPEYLNPKIIPKEQPKYKKFQKWTLIIATILIIFALAIILNNQ